MATMRTNWAGNLAFEGALHEPASVDELRSLLTAASAESRRLRALGSAHSFSPVADSDTEGGQVSLARMPVVRELDTARGLARVSGGLRYGEVTPWLHEQGFALHNLGSLPHIGVAGACATGTHGSGDGNGVLATAVRALRLVTPSGDVVELSADGEGPGCGDEFAGAVVALGSLGVVTEVTLAVEPTYDVAQTVYDDLPFAAVEDDFDAIMGAAYSVSLFTRWVGDTFDTAWLKRRDADGPAPEELFGARRASGPRHPLRGQPVEPATEQGGVPGPWHTRLPHFRLEFTPSAGEELQSEYLLPREHAVEALRAVREIGADVSRVLLVSEIRSMRADDLWLSGAYGRDTVGVHFTWVRDVDAVLPVAALVEERLLPLGARPHWGKVFAAGPDAVRPLYPRIDDAARLAATFDPAGVMRNAFVDAYLWGDR
ncbi:MAG: FAD-binding protein [Kineosporiaceae bacterium]